MALSPSQSALPDDLPDDLPDELASVLAAAAQTKGNRSRFRRAGLVDLAGQLVPDWRSAFVRLAPLDKAELRARPGAFLAQATDIVYRGKTSGTGGEAFTYFAGQRWNQGRMAARQRGLAGWGLDAETPILNLASRLAPVRPQDLSLVGAIDGDFLAQLRQQVEAQPLILRGYPSRLCEVAVALHHPGPAPLGPVRAVIATGECLFESQRSLLQQTFKAPIINEYGSQESGISGLSCPEAGRLHLDGDRCFYEIINGRLVTTDLHNLAMPLVRYCGGDVLRLLTDPCPCGRPGPTAVVLGREEEAMPVQGEQRWPGEFDLPSFPDILSYQLQLYPDHRRLWLQPAMVLDPADPQLQAQVQPLQAWLTDCFGPQPTQLLVETPQSNAWASRLQGSDSETWLGRVTGGAWSDWLSQPLPLGEAQDVAALLQQLVAPRLIALGGLPAQTVALTTKLLASAPALAPAVEAMKIRVLLWAVGLLAGAEPGVGVGVGMDIDFPQPVHQQYQALLERFQLWRAGFASFPSSARFPGSAMAFDLMAPLLTLETQFAEMLWQPVQALIQQTWSGPVKADAFSFHHYLAILDQAGWKAQRRSHPWLPALRPLPAMLLGDLFQVAPRLDLSHVALWAEIVHHRPGRFVGSTTDVGLGKPGFEQTGFEQTGFDRAWQGHRQALLGRDQTAMAECLSQCFDQAESAAETAQCWLERAYGSLVFEAEIDPLAWLNILRDQVGLLGTRPGSSSAVSNPLPWLPLLTVLAPKLIERGEPELAYACLFAAAPPHRHQSNFDRQTQAANGKQSALSWNREP